MSKNLDLVRSICAAWERGDYGSVAWAHPAIEFVIADGPTPGSWTGMARIGEGWREWLSAWGEYSTGVEEYREVDGEHVLVLVHSSGHGKTSGVEIEQITTRGLMLFDVQEGNVTRLVIYFDRARALADLGLAE